MQLVVTMSLSCLWCASDKLYFVKTRRAIKLYQWEKFLNPSFIHHAVLLNWLWRLLQTLCLPSIFWHKAAVWVDGGPSDSSGVTGWRAVLNLLLHSPRHPSFARSAFLITSAIVCWNLNRPQDLATFNCTSVKHHPYSCWKTWRTGRQEVTLSHLHIA